MIKVKNIKYMDKEKVTRILMTDIQLHSTRSTNPQPLKRKLEKAIKSGKEERFFGKIIKIEENGSIEFFIPKVQLNQNVEIIVSKNMPITFGKDAIEKIKSLKKKK
jgi:hypothetical protein